MAMTVQPPKGRLGLYAWTVWGSLYSSVMSPHGGGLIGGPCFVPGPHKGIGVRLCRGWGSREAAAGTETGAGFP